MLGSVIELGFSIFFVVVSALSLWVFLRGKTVANGLLALSVQEFHDACDALLKTPNELPDEVLDAIMKMSDSTFSKGSNWRLKQAIRLDRKGILPSCDDNPLDAAVESMRDELQQLFTKAVASWLNILTHRSLIVGLMIAYEAYRLQLAHGKLEPDAGLEKMKVLPSVTHCAA